VSSLFGIIDLGLSALVAHRGAMDTEGHNLANVDTPGYHRQDALLTTNPGLPAVGSSMSLRGGQYGSGVRVATVRRAQESFLGLQTRMLKAITGRWSSAASPLREAESILSPGPGEDLSARLDEFWDAWESVANKPENISLRANLRESASTLADILRSDTQRLESTRLTIDAGVRSRVDEVNTLARQVAELSRQISVAQIEGRSPNDILDTRDRSLERLSELCGAMPFNSEGGQLIIYLDGRVLVQGESYYPISMTTGAGGVEIRSGYDSSTIQVGNGEIGGLLYARDTSIPAYLEQLNTLAGTLVTEVNARHRAGFGLDGVDQRDFFVAGGTAGDITLDLAIRADVRAIATAQAASAPGDGSVALDIANLRTTAVLGGQSLGQVAQGMLGGVGKDISRADVEVTAAGAAMDQIRQQEQSVSGVSIDEELTYLTETQRAYQAAARVISVANDLLGVVIEQMGV
jgi:flagellar hook-associated protein 1 FlgK